jgi:hypothetical protein
VSLRRFLSEKGSRNMCDTTMDRRPCTLLLGPCEVPNQDYDGESWKRGEKSIFYEVTVELVEEEKLGGSFNGKFGIKREEKKRDHFFVRAILISTSFFCLSRGDQNNRPTKDTQKSYVLLRNSN